MEGILYGYTFHFFHYSSTIFKISRKHSKSLNSQILESRHYYKFALCKKEFGDSDAFIRMRLRRYIARNKDSKNKEGKLLLTNSALKRMGLKSLLAINE